VHAGVLRLSLGICQAGAAHRRLERAHEVVVPGDASACGWKHEAELTRRFVLKDLVSACGNRPGRRIPVSRL
jgi:hypothetical protein